MVAHASFDSELGRRARKHNVAVDAEEYGRRGGLAVRCQTIGEGVIKSQETDFVAAAPRTRPSTIRNEFSDGDGADAGLEGPLPDADPTRNGEADVKRYTTFRDVGVCFFPCW